MLSAGKSQAELQIQRTKLTSSYNALLQEFSSKDLRTVGNYTLGRLIGKGSFGKVYLATHKLTKGSKVVLKSAEKDDSNLIREIHHHRQFLHPHIARLYEVIITESLVWLVLEYCPGDELYNYLTHHGPIEPSTVQKIFAQLVGAVSYVHSKSCVHRDLKLENILLDKNENVKLCDFGFTREYEGKSSYLQTWCGTVCYSAPEMLKGEKYAAEKVDVWSLGVILYALLCGELPFDEESETETKVKILREEPKYPDFMPVAAKDLIVLLLSKRALLRPSLADILTNPWLEDHAPQQQGILKLQQPAPFTTRLEKDTLERMRNTGVDIDLVIENVLSQRCDSLAGWWALLVDKQERKEKRRLEKRRDKDLEVKASRRLSAMSARSGRMELLASTIKESAEEGSLPPENEDSSKERGRGLNRANGNEASLPTMRKSPGGPLDRQESSSLLVTQRNMPRAISASRRRSQPGSGEYRKRNSTLQLVASTQNLFGSDSIQKKRKRGYQHPFFNHLASIKHWFKDSAKSAKSTDPRNGALLPRDPAPKWNMQNPHLGTTNITPSKNLDVNFRPNLQTRATNPALPRLSTHTSNGSARRLSHSPSAIISPSAYRQSSNLRGRKSTSSSVSSVRSIHANQHPSLSKASSTSSNSLTSPSVSMKSLTAANHRNSPKNSVKVIAAIPASSTFSDNARVIRRNLPTNLALTESNAAFSGLGPPSPGLIFAKRKRTPFKGPMLGPGSAKRRSDGGGGSVSRSGSLQGRPSGEIIEEEDEEEDVEEVDHFVAVTGPGEYVVEDVLIEEERPPVDIGLETGQACFCGN